MHKNDEQTSNKKFIKRGQEIEFLATTDFFIKNRITDQQIYTIHFAHLSVDDIHTKNQCSTNVGSQCKQTMDTLTNVYSDVDPNILVTFVDSLYVGKYNEAPIFLKSNGDLRDFNDFRYWVTYSENDQQTFMFWDDWIQNNIENFMNTIYTPLFQSAQSWIGNITENQRKTISSHVLDLDLIKKAQIFSHNKTDNDKIFVGFNTYTRNSPFKDEKIYIKSDGYFIDNKNNNFWPTYETTVKYHNDLPYGVYTFYPFNAFYPPSWMEPWVINWYFFLNPRNQEWLTNTQGILPYFIAIFYILFYGAEVYGFISYEKINLMSNYTHTEFHRSTLQAPTTHQQPTITTHNTNPKFSATKLHHDIREKAHYQSKLDAAEKDNDTAKIDKYKADVAKYNDHEMKQLAMRDKQSDISIDQQKEMFDKKFHEHETKVYNDCKTSIESFVKSGETTTTFLFGNTEKFYNVPSTITNNMTSCQKSFIQACNSMSNHCGDMGSVDGNSLKDNSSLISKAIDSVSKVHAHNEAVQYSQNVMKEFTKEYNLLDSEKAAVPELNPSINTLPNDPLQPTIEKYEAFNPMKLLRKSNLEKEGDALLYFDAQYILSENKQYVDQWTMEKEMEHRIYIIKKKKENAEYALDHNTNLSEELKTELRNQIEKYGKLISVLTKKK